MVEGVVDHHILHLHRVYERLGPSYWDWLFLAFAVALVGIGRAVMRSARALD